MCLCGIGSVALAGSRSVASSRTSVDTGSPESFIYPRRVLVIRAGPRPRRHAFVLLNKRTARNMEQVLSGFASAVAVDVKQVYGVKTATQVRYVSFTVLSASVASSQTVVRSGPEFIKLCSDFYCV